MPNKPASIEIVEEKEGRFVLTTFADGTVERTPESILRPLQRAKVERMNHTRKKRF